MELNIGLQKILAIIYEAETKSRNANGIKTQTRDDTGTLVPGKT